MRKSFLLVATTSLMLSACGSVDSKDMNLTDELVTALPADVISADLFTGLSSSLGVTDQQAKGGVGALMALANNSLGEQGLGALGEQLLGGNNANILSSITSMDSVVGVFESLGMNKDMIGQFTPQILEYIDGKTGNTGLVSKLGSIWAA